MELFCNLNGALLCPTVVHMRSSRVEATHGVHTLPTVKQLSFDPSWGFEHAATSTQRVSVAAATDCMHCGGKVLCSCRSACALTLH